MGGPERALTLASGSIGSGATFSLDPTVLAHAGLSPLIVSVSGRAAVSQSLAPAVGIGVVTMPGIPLSLQSGG